MTTTCLHCSSQSSLLAPPHNPPPESKPTTTEQTPSGTSSRTTTKSLDGPIRRKRREKLVRPIPFWQRSDHLVVSTNELYQYVPPAGIGGKGKESNKRQPKQEKGQGKAKVNAEVQGGKGERKQQKGKKDLVVEATMAAAKTKPPSNPVLPVVQPIAGAVEMDEEEMMNLL
jgi:hypothetical protein